MANDRAALSMFMTRDRRIAGPGDRLTNADLAITLARIRGRGPGDFYEGALAKELADAADASGASLAADDLRTAVPRWYAPRTADNGRYVATVTEDPEGEGAEAAGGATIVTADQDGAVVACSFEMNAPFGLGIAARGFGFLFGAAVATARAQMIAYTAADGQVFAAGAVGGSDAEKAAGRLMAAAESGVIEADDLAAAQQPEMSFSIISCAQSLAADGKKCMLRGWPAAADVHAFAGYKE